MCADIAALDQTLVYNRFGSFNPFGMIFALRRDLVPLREVAAHDAPLTAQQCDNATFTAPGPADGLSPGEVRLRDCKRPRPLTLRVNVGDTFVVRVTNYLTPPDAGDIRGDENGAIAQAGLFNVLDFSKDVCAAPPTQDASREAALAGLSRGDALDGLHHEVSCAPPSTGAPGRAPDGSDWPNTRGLSFVVQGLVPRAVDGGLPPAACTGFDSAAPGEANSFVCVYEIAGEGTFFFASGRGGGIVHGLFGAVIAERAGSQVYRSQTSRAVFDEVWPGAAAGAPRHARTRLPVYEKTDDRSGMPPGTGMPYLNMLRALDRPQAEFGAARLAEIVHADLNAIVWCDRSQKPGGCVPRETLRRHRLRPRRSIPPRPAWPRNTTPSASSRSSSMTRPRHSTRSSSRSFSVSASSPAWVTALPSTTAPAAWERCFWPTGRGSAPRRIAWNASTRSSS